MTREQKIEWLREADIDKLLKQYETTAVRAHDPFDTVARDSRYTIEGIIEDMELVRAEVIRRMSK